MGFGLKILSIIMGSSEETLLNARKEMKFLTNNDEISDEVERMYIYEELGFCIKELLKVNSKEFTKVTLKKNKNMVQAIVLSINYYIDSRNKQKLQILNRVIFRYYGFTIGGSYENFQPAIRQLANDMIRYCESAQIL